MDALGSYLITEIIKSLGEGNFVRGVAWLAVFIVIWLEVRSLKKSVKKIGENIATSFAQGETRFSDLEKKQMEFEHRLTMLES